ncbi:MAG: transcriptional regulator [Pseudomonadota bacterium]
MKILAHPTREQLELPTVLDCLGDPTRLAIVHGLAQHERVGTELRCGNFSGVGAKSNLAYHFGRLRETGVIRVRIEGTARYISLRREDLEARFPGLLDAILAAAARDVDRLALADCTFTAPANETPQAQSSRA